MARLATFGIALAASALLLSGCTPTPAPTDSPTATTRPPAPSPTLAPEPRGDAHDYGFTFFHGAQMGSTWDEMSVQLNYPVGGIADCPYYGDLWSTAVTWTYAFTDQMDPAAGTRFFYTMQGSAPATAPFPRNAEGVGIGSTQAELLAAFPDAVVDSVTDLGVGDIATVTVDDPSSDSRYVYGFSGGSATVDLLQWGPDAGHQWSHLCGGF